MHSPPSTSTSRSSHRNGSLQSSSYGSPTSFGPTTPQMGYMTLPPSPLSPNNAYAPRAPHMGTVSLPPSMPATPMHASHGLLTPPHTPPESRQALQTINPVLAYGQTPLYFNISQPPQQQLRLSPATLQEPAFAVLSARTFVRIVGTNWAIPIDAPHTVAGVLQQIHAWISQHCGKDDSRGLPPQVVDMAAQYMAARRGSHMRRYDCLGHGLRFAGLVRATDGSDCWDLYLTNLS